MKTSNFLLKTGVMFAFVFVMTIGCKEEDTLDPNIAYKAYNISLTNTTSAVDDDQELEFDLNGDGFDDFKLDAEFQNVGGDTTITQIELQSTTMENEILTEDFVFPNSSSTPKLKPLTDGFKINSTSDFSEFGFAVLSANKGVTNLGNFGFTDGLDKLIGFSFYIGSERHYGWLKINVSSDLKTLTVKDGAYHKIADTEIGAGDK